jgi:hypothetical protein
MNLTLARPHSAHNNARSDLGYRPDRKPLYLIVSRPAQMKAGPDHLVLHRAEVAPQNYPLARVARIICSHHIMWSGQALALCMTHQISITWLGAHGRAIGYTQSLGQPPYPAAVLIECYLECPQWAQHFNNWLRHRRMNVLHTCARRAQTADHPYSAEYLAELKREFVYQGDIQPCFPSEGEGWSHALAVDRLQREGLAATWWGYDAVPFALAEELARLLWAELNLTCGALPAHGDNMTAARFFETWAWTHGDRLMEHLGDFKRHMAGALTHQSVI